MARVLADNNYPLDYHIVEAVLAANNAWCSTPAGKQFLAAALGLAVEGGHSEDEYQYRGEPVPHTQVQLIYGYTIRGTPAHPGEVDVSRKPLVECDFCNQKTICAEEVRTGEGMYAMSCSACVSRRDDLRLKYGGKSCDDCTYQKCPNHPKHTRF